jgi:replicative DNA helicase
MSVDLIPPHDYEAEKALLGCILNKDTVLDDVLQTLAPSDFFSYRNAVVYAAMERMAAKNVRIDTLTIRDEFTDKEMEVLENPIYLLELQSAVPTTAYWKRYAEIVRRTSLLRQLIQVGGEVVSMGYDNGDNVEEVLGEAASKVLGLSLQASHETIPVGTVLENLLQNLRSGVDNFITFPYIPWVKARPGDLIVVAAGTSVGKTALTLNWADEWSKTKHVTYFEYEMSEVNLMTRLVCKHAGVAWDSILDGTLTAEEHIRVEDASKELSKRTLRLQEVYCNNHALFAKIRREAQRGAEVIIIDHLGLVPFAQSKGMNYAKSVGTEMTNPLKRLSTELGIVIILLVQMNREGQKDTHYPKLHHLRDSGEIEQDASVVFTLWSERTIQDDTAKTVALREKTGMFDHDELFDTSMMLTRIGVEKNRNGRLGEHFIIYHGESFSYEDRSEIVSPIKGGRLFSVDKTDEPVYTEALSADGE